MKFGEERYFRRLGGFRESMKVYWVIVPALLLVGFSFASPFNRDKADPAHSPNRLAGVQNLTRIKILESNNVTLRPGSVDDTASYYEVLLDVSRSGFNYEFLDAGLGAAEPVYPMFEKGHQGSYARLIPSFFTDNRHIDNYATADTPEGCHDDSAYLSRNITDYPETELRKERDEGFTIMLLRLDYYTRLRPDAVCGRHRANDPDPNFDPMKFIETYQDAM
jgi:hypothetical protein